MNGKMCKMMVVAIGAMAALNLGAGIFDDAMIWFRGGFDKNGDGIFTADEFVDTAHAKTAAKYQKCTIKGTGTVAYEKGAVWSNFNPLSTNIQYYISLKNGDKASKDECNSIKAVNPYTGDEVCSNFTLFVRFRWDGKISKAASSNIMILFNNGQNWAGQRGLRVGFKYFEATDDFATYWQFGADGDKWNKSNQGSIDPSETNGIKLTPGEWYDWVLRVSDNGVNKTACVQAIRSSTPGTTTYQWENNFYKMPYLSEWKNLAADRCNAIKMQAVSEFYIADSSFSGDIATWAYWPKYLNDDEIREVMSELRPGDAVFRLGKEDGKCDEFAAEACKTNSFDADTTWDVIPASLADGESFTVNFGIANSCATNQSFPLNQIFRLVAASGTGAVSVVVNDLTNKLSKRFRNRAIYPGHPANFLIPLDELRVGNHSLTVTFTKTIANCNAIELDVAELRGSWTLGRIRWSYLSNNSPFLGTGLTPYDLINGYWPAMPPSFSNEEAIDSANPYKSATIRFNVPADLVVCTNSFVISGDQWNTKRPPATIDVYINNIKIWTAPSESIYQYNVWSVTIPPNTFVAGENVIQVRVKATEVSGQNWWGGARGYQLKVLSEPEVENPFGAVILFK